LNHGSGNFTVTATNGYTSQTVQYNYTIVADAMICYSTAGNSFPLIAKKTLSIPITTVLRSGAAVNDITAGYLYGLNLTATSLSGTFGSGVYPDVVLQSNSTLITISSSSSTGSISSTLFEIVTTNHQTITNLFAVGGNVYYSIDSLNGRIPATTGSGNLIINPATITDFQSGTPGSSNFMIATRTNATYYSADGGHTYTQIQNPGLFANIYQVALANLNWYGIATTGDGKSQLVWGPSWTPLSVSSGSYPAQRTDGGLVLRSVKIQQEFPPTDPPRPVFININNVTSDGNTLTYYLSSGAGFLNYPISGIFSFYGFSSSGFNLEAVPGTLIANQTITVASPNTGVSSSGYVIMYDNSISLAPCRLLFGGTGLVYAPAVNTSAAIVTTNCSLEEVRDLSTNVPTMIIAAGGYQSNNQPSTAHVTLQYSTDYGVTWNTSINDFSWYATNVVWGGHVNTVEGTTRIWIALGKNKTGIPGIKCSTDGMNWTDVSIGVTMTSSTVLGPLQFDGTNWNLVVDGIVYSHDANIATIALASWWTATGITGITSLCSTPWVNGLTTPTTTLRIGVTSAGPTFSSPTAVAYLYFQYIPISTIVFDTVEEGTSFFIASTLPAGLAWNPAVVGKSGHTYATISGRPVILGTSSIDIYAEGTTGISKITITITTKPIPLKTPDTTPSGYTSFLKQKVIADSAVSSINNKALVSPVGTFLANDPKPEITAPEICCLDQPTQ
jgi:hypothetical protein